MFSPLAIQKTKQFGARAIERVGVNVNAIDVVGEGHQTETVCEPVGKIVGAQVETQTRGNEVKEEAGMAEARNAITKFVEVGSGESEWHGNLNALAEIEAFERGLAGKLRMFFAESTDDAAEILTKSGDRRVIANVEGGELFGEGIAVGIGKNPLGKIVGKTFRKKVVAAEGLKGVVKNGGVAALLEAGQEFSESASREIADAREIGNGEKFEASSI